MNRSAVRSPSAAPVVQPLPLAAQSGFGLRTLRGASPLRIELLPTGAPYAFRHGGTLLNQVLPGPASDGLFQFHLRLLDPAGQPLRTQPLVAAGLDFTAGETSATWHSAAASSGLRAVTTLQLHPREAAWSWSVRVINTGAAPLRCDVLHAQDLGLADESAVRNNEAYVSQYLDLRPERDPELGWTILVRQNQPMEGGRRPWAAFACLAGADSFCTDGFQFFGADHRLTGEAAALAAPQLPSKRLQYEFAVAGLQSRPLELPAGGSAEVRFVALYRPDHPAASSAADLAPLREIAAGFPAPEPISAGKPVSAPGVSLFTSAPWLHGAMPTDEELFAWFPGPHRHTERAPGQGTLAFFCDAQTHVVTRAKETAIARPHGHLLRSGDYGWIDDAQFGLTAYASGIFAAQTYLGNPSIARLLPIVRNPLNLVRDGGQRVFVRDGGAWCQLGVPSAFAMTPGDLRWIYRLENGDRIEARVACSPQLPAAFLELRVVAGGPREFLIAHQLALGANEFENAATAQLFADFGWIACQPPEDSFTGRHLPGTCFALATADPSAFAVLGGDELIYADGQTRGGPYVAFLSHPVTRCGVIQIGATEGPLALPALVAAARAEATAGLAAAAPAAAGLALRGAADPGLSRIAEVVPWFNHNAAIHFSAPHGLEQSGGAAWGVRDVCQGSLEWLLATGRFDTARRMLLTVFAQQYARDGSWPQWFMFPPFQTIQQAHSHGDVCFWPVKALCDYAEATDDLAFLATPVGYTDPEKFLPAGPAETLWAHGDRVVDHAESRFVPGTALVNYGDGDWDDTLQPADPAMRTRMISAWTVGLAFHTFRQFAEVSRRAGETARAARLEKLLARMRVDFAGQLMPDGIVAGFGVSEGDGTLRPLLHPRDRVTGIRYRLLPMTRSVLAELFTPEEAARHLALIERELRFTDGVRLMSEPAVYHDGLEKLFKRADTAANVGREIGLQYVHAHLRYAEAMAKVGDADLLWTALQVVNPVGLAEAVPTAAPRQSNVYFSSSDADFADRYEAAARWDELRAGRVAVRGGWRLYSSGPGLFLHKVRACLLGLRESFGDFVFDPVLPRSLDGLVVETTLGGVALEIHYRIRQRTSGPSALRLDGAVLPTADREPNPYRLGGLRVPRALFAGGTGKPRQLEIEL